MTDLRLTLQEWLTRAESVCAQTARDSVWWPDMWKSVCKNIDMLSLETKHREHQVRVIIEPHGQMVAPDEMLYIWEWHASVDGKHVATENLEHFGARYLARKIDDHVESLRPHTWTCRLCQRAHVAADVECLQRSGAFVCRSCLPIFMT